MKRLLRDLQMLDDPTDRLALPLKALSLPELTDDLLRRMPAALQL